MTQLNLLNELANKMTEELHYFDELVASTLLCASLINKRDCLNHWDEMVQQFQAQMRDYV